VYTVQDLEENRAQLRQRMIRTFVPAGLLLALTLVSFFLRWPQVITILLCIALCALLIFCYGMFIAPVRAYGKHIDHALNGRTRDAEGEFRGFDPETVLRDGINFIPLTINVGDTPKVGGDRLFYWDANLPQPDWREGERLVLTSYDNRVTAWRRVA